MKFSCWRALQMQTQFEFLCELYRFLACGDKCPESYLCTPGVGVGAGVRVHKNFNLAYNSWTIIGRTFIFPMCIPCDKTFPWVPQFLTGWPWPWSLTYFWKTLTLAIASLPEKIGLSYLMYIPCDKTFPLAPNFFYLVTMTLQVDLPPKKLEPWP